MARRLLDESFATTYENYLGHFLAAQYRAINSEPFDRLVARAARQDRLGRIGAASGNVTREEPMKTRDVYIAGSAHTPRGACSLRADRDGAWPAHRHNPKMARWIERMRPIMAEMLGVKFCHYAIDPQTRKPTEDNVTMSVKSAGGPWTWPASNRRTWTCLSTAERHGEPCPPTSTLIQEELKIPACAEYSIHSNCTSIYKALQLPPIRSSSADTRPPCS